MSPTSAGESVDPPVIQGILVPTVFPLPAILHAGIQPAVRPPSTVQRFRQTRKKRYTL